MRFEGRLSSIDVIKVAAILAVVIQHARIEFAASMLAAGFIGFTTEPRRKQHAASSWFASMSAAQSKGFYFGRSLRHYAIVAASMCGSSAS